MDYSEQRYLAAKRTVDDRALNRGVLQALKAALAAQGCTRPRVLELGAGVGTMLSRLVDWDVVNSGSFTLVDRDGASLNAARRRLCEWAGVVDDGAGPLQLQRGGSQLDVTMREADIFEYLARPDTAGHDLVVANAVLDLIDVPSLLPRLWRALVPGGLFWFTINFDGETIFLPEMPADDQIMALYHQSMNRRRIDGRPAGDSKCGRHLLEHIPGSGAEILAAGGSDWVVVARDGNYPADETYFLHHIIDTLDRELGARPDLAPKDFLNWVEARHEQVEAGTLVYIAHQLDVAGRAPSP